MNIGLQGQRVLTPAPHALVFQPRSILLASSPPLPPARYLPMPGGDPNVTLAIEAAGPDASVAVGRGPALLHIEPVSNAARHDDDLMPAIARAFDRIAALPKDLEVVFVSVGPGGFTGLRIAVSTAKTLALALKCRVVAVSEADAVAETSPAAGPLAICLTGKHGRYWTAFQEKKDGPASSGQLLAIPDVIEASTRRGVARIAVCQPHNRVTDLAAASAAAGLDIVEVFPDASHVWRVGRRIAETGRFTAPEQLLPIYPREPEAVRLWRQRKA